MKTNVSWVGAVLASIFSLFTMLTYADEASSRVYVKNVTLQYLPNPNVSIPLSIVGKHVCVPRDVFLGNSKAFKLSFEIYKTDGAITYDIQRLNFISLGVMSFIDKNGDIYQQVSNTGIYKNLAEEKFVYTDGVTSPAINQGMHIVPLDKNNKVVTALVGSGILDPNPYLMNNGAFKVHSNVGMKLHKVNIINMPLIFDDTTKNFISNVTRNNSKVQYSLNIELTMTVNACLNIENGCFYEPVFNSSDSRPWVHFDTKTPYGRSYQPVLADPTTLVIPNGFGSWLDLYESETPSELGRKVDLSTCMIETGAIPQSYPPNPTTLIVGGLTQSSRKFYTLRTRVP